MTSEQADLSGWRVNDRALNGQKRKVKMATVTVKVIGSNPREVTAATVGDLKRQLGLATYTASVNKEPADDGTRLGDNDFIVLAPSVKGG